MTPRLPVEPGDGDANRLIAAALMATIAIPVRRLFVAAASSALDRREQVVAVGEADADRNLAEVAAAGDASHALLAQLAEALLHVRRERESIRVLRATIANVSIEFDRIEQVAGDATRAT